jgi:NTE family protein
MSQFRNLIFEGGGVKGIAYAGAIKVLNEKNILADICRVGGTSAGAITAALLALGAGWTDVRDIVGGTDFRNFMDDSWGFVRNVVRLFKNFGICRGKSFTKWMRGQIGNMTGNPNLTFADLEKLKAEDAAKFRSLYIVGTNLSKQIPEVFSAENTPNMMIGEAVRISMSIPLFFAAILSNNETWVDGGITWNYPIDLFDNKKYISAPDNPNLYQLPEHPEKYKQDYVYNKETLGFRVDTEEEIALMKRTKEQPSIKIKNIKQYLTMTIGFMTDIANKAHLQENDWHRTVFIDAKGVKTTDFGLSEKRVEDLIQSGDDGAKEYFKWFEDGRQRPRNRCKENTKIAVTK